MMMMIGRDSYAAQLAGRIYRFAGLDWPSHISRCPCNKHTQARARTLPKNPTHGSFYMVNKGRQTVKHPPRRNAHCTRRFAIANFMFEYVMLVVYSCCCCAKVVYSLALGSSAIPYIHVYIPDASLMAAAEPGMVVPQNAYPAIVDLPASSPFPNQQQL